MDWFVPPTFSNPIIIFLTVSTVGLYGFISRQRTLRPQDFVKVYLGTTVLRILFFGTFIFLLIRMNPSGARANATLFLAGYFLFTALEVVVLFCEINSPKEPKG